MPENWDEDPVNFLLWNIKYSTSVQKICGQSQLKWSIENTGLPNWQSRKESTCPCRWYTRPGFNPWVGKIPWRRKWLPTPVSLPGKSHGQRSLAGYTPWDHEQLDTTEWLHTHTHTHTHTLKIPAIEFRNVYYLVSLILPDRMIWDKFGTTQGSGPSIF